MPESEQGQIYLFDVEGVYLFKYYFGDSDIHAELRHYYNQNKYRYEIPGDDIQFVIEYLEQQGYRLFRVNTIQEFVVVTDDQHSTGTIQRNAVVEWAGSEYDYFIMQSPSAITDAVEQGATRLENTELTAEFEISDSVQNPQINTDMSR